MPSLSLLSDRTSVSLRITGQAKCLILTDLWSLWAAVSTLIKTASTARVPGPDYNLTGFAELLYDQHSWQAHEPPHPRAEMCLIALEVVRKPQRPCILHLLDAAVLFLRSLGMVVLTACTKRSSPKLGQTFAQGVSALIQARVNFAACRSTVSASKWYLCNMCMLSIWHRSPSMARLPMLLWQSLFNPS